MWTLRLSQEPMKWEEFSTESTVDIFWRTLLRSVKVCCGVEEPWWTRDYMKVGPCLQCSGLSISYLWHASGFRTVVFSSYMVSFISKIHARRFIRDLWTVDIGETLIGLNPLRIKPITSKVRMYLPVLTLTWTYWGKAVLWFNRFVLFILHT